MENKTNETTTVVKKEFTEVSVSNLKHGDIIYVSKTEKSVPFVVIDVGAPFILLENTKTHFASLYRSVNGVVYTCKEAF